MLSCHIYNMFCRSTQHVPGFACHWNIFLGQTNKAPEQTSSSSSSEVSRMSLSSHFPSNCTVHVHEVQWLKLISGNRYEISYAEINGVE